MRLIGVALLIYFIVNSIRSDEFSAGNIVQLVIVTVMAIWAAVIIGLTVAELVINLKNGAYAKRYYCETAEAPGAGEAGSAGSEDVAPDSDAHGGGEA